MASWEDGAGGELAHLSAALKQQKFVIGCGHHSGIPEGIGEMAQCHVSVVASDLESRPIRVQICADKCGIIREAEVEADVCRILKAMSAILRTRWNYSIHDHFIFRRSHWSEGEGGTRNLDPLNRACCAASLCSQVCNLGRIQVILLSGYAGGAREWADQIYGRFQSGVWVKHTIVHGAEIHGQLDRWPRR